MPIQLLLSVVLMVALVGTWQRRGRGMLSGRDLLAWTALWVGGLLVTWWPSLSSTIAEVFGVGRGVDLVTYLVVIFLCYNAFRQELRNVELEREITLLVRKMALEEVEKWGVGGGVEDGKSGKAEGLSLEVKNKEAEKQTILA